MATATSKTDAGAGDKQVVQLDDITVRFCGDSGDGMQLAGTQMTNTSALFGNDVSTLPDYPAEIRAPAGSLAGVSGFQLHFGSRKLLTPGDQVNALVAMNPAALKTNIDDLEEGGILVVNDDAFNKSNLGKAGYESNPLDEDRMKRYQLHRIPIDKLNAEATKDSGLTGRAAARCKNFYALGVIYWLYGRPLDATLAWNESKFGTKPAVMEANAAALRAGYYFGETTEIFQTQYRVEPATIPPGKYRRVSGNEAVALGMVAAATIAKKTLFYGSYPITPASDILHELARYKNYDVRTFQAEDEIAAVTSALGASFTGALGATGTSGPGMALKGEAFGLAVMTELPLVIINVQRGGPSTGLPTKTEQADLHQALYGRNSEAPLCVLAPQTPADCFNITLEAFRIAVEYMTPVIVLSDGYLANGAEPWKLPEIDSLPKIEVRHPKEGDEYAAYMRNDRLSRPWAIPGTKGLEHRVGGLEKENITGNVSYDPENHEMMVRLRRKKIDKIADSIPDLEINGESKGDLLVLGWGSTFGAIETAVENLQKEGLNVSSAHLRYLDPMPKNTESVLKSFSRILVPELNLGQLCSVVNSKFDVKAESLSKVQGKPFMVREIETRVREILSKGSN